MVPYNYIYRISFIRLKEDFASNKKVTYENEIAEYTAEP